MTETTWERRAREIREGIAAGEPLCRPGRDALRESWPTKGGRVSAGAVLGIEDRGVNNKGER